MVKVVGFAAVIGTLMAMAAGPLSGQESRSANRRCAPLSLKRKLPSVDNVVDSAALTAAVPREGDGVYLFSISGGVGRSLAARPLEERGVQISDTVTALVAAALRADPEAVAPAIRLRVTTGAEPALAIEKSILCPPVTTPGTVMGRVSVTTTSPPPARVRKPKIRLRIAADGTVMETELRSSSGVPELDREIMSFAARDSFQPALLDGKPIEVWLEDGRAEIVQ